MNNNGFDLDKVWQQQDTVEVDFQLLKRQWWLMRMKQYFYILLDALATISIPVIVFTFPKKVTTGESIWLWTVFALGVLWFCYLLWLRRFSLGFTSNSVATSDFTERVKLQYKQNIKIAYVNKVLCYFTPLVFVSYFFVGYFEGIADQQNVMTKVRTMLILNVICLPLVWLWMHKREHKFRRLLADFELQWALK